MHISNMFRGPGFGVCLLVARKNRRWVGSANNKMQFVRERGGGIVWFPQFDENRMIRRCYFIIIIITPIIIVTTRIHGHLGRSIKDNQ